jgi:hypothetical protein
MKLGLSGAPVPSGLPYAPQINEAADVEDFWPMFLYAVAYRETIVSQLNRQIASAATYVSFDNGHGLFQLTESWPDGWADPLTNACYAVKYFLAPAVEFWNGEMGMTGIDLLRCVAAEYNAGRTAALAGHNQGDVDTYTSNGYAAAVLFYYQMLLRTGRPV